jgi:dihydrofolate reductase
MKIHHIVAASENRVIGRQGGMPWHIPEDFKFFKATTMGHAMIMGRKTWKSIGRALPGRLTIVITRDTSLIVPAGVVIKRSIDDAINYCDSQKATWGDQCFIVGGGEIYKQTMDRAHQIYLTVVHKQIDGDTYYPEIDQAQFVKISQEDHLDASIPFSFTVWLRNEAT